MRLLTTILSAVVTTGMVVAQCDVGGYNDPRTNGGSLLTSWADTDGNHEPLNVILSADSDPAVLKDSALGGGFQRLMLSANISQEFLGLHLGAPQMADLGDGRGLVNQTRVLRYNYGDPVAGTGLESVKGGNHLRYWIQSTTGAYFLAVSVEMDLQHHHDIVPDGYNLGRDQLVSSLVGQNITTASLQAGDRFEGSSHSLGWTFHTVAEYVGGLLEKTSDGINHAATVGVKGPAIDGLVAVLTVKISKKGLL